MFGQALTVLQKRGGRRILSGKKAAAIWIWRVNTSRLFFAAALLHCLFFVRATQLPTDFLQISAY
jgi:hypothetical protein